MGASGQSIEEGVQSADVIKEEKDENGEFFGAFFRSWRGVFSLSESSLWGACTAATEEDKTGFSIGFELLN